MQVMSLHLDDTDHFGTAAFVSGGAGPETVFRIAASRMSVVVREPHGILPDDISSTSVHCCCNQVSSFGPFRQQFLMTSKPTCWLDPRCHLSGLGPGGSVKRRTKTNQDSLCLVVTAMNITPTPHN